MMKSTLDLATVTQQLAARGLGTMVPDLDRITALLDLLGNPQQTYPAIHVTGTNGKGSTTRMIDALLTAHELRVGRYSSPELFALTERISIDGRDVSPEAFVATYQELAPMVALLDERAAAVGGPAVTHFEFVTAMAFAAFADAPVEAAVVEVGIGGRWDATNVVEAPVAVLTPIALDHTAYLGPDLTAIATEKAGIIHRDATVITAAQPAAALAPIVDRVAAVDGVLAREGSEFGLVNREMAVGGQQLVLQGLHARYDEIFLSLYGAHQAQNASLAVAAVEAFLGSALELELVQQGFAAVTSPGRLERMRTSPTILLDAAHNPAALNTVLEAVTETFGFRKLIVVLGVLADKDVRGMLEALEPVADELIVTQSSSERRIEADELAALAVPLFGPDRIEVAPRLDDAIDAAVRLAELDTADGVLNGAGVLVTGSVTTAADARRLLLGGGA